MATISDLIYRFGADMGMVDKAFDQVESRSKGVSGILKSALGTATGFIGAEVAMRGVGSAFGFIKGAAIGMNSQLQTAQLQFETLMGDAGRAEEHVASLFEFAKKTPFETGPIIQASRMLQTFGGDALNTNEHLTRLGDASAAVSQSMDDVSFWVGRAFSAIQAGKPFGEAAARLQEMAILSPQARAEMEELQKAGASADEVFGVLTNDLDRFGGAMEKQAGTWEGLTSTFSDTINIVMATAFRPFFDMVSGGLGRINNILGSDGVTATAERFADVVATGFQAAGSMVMGFINRVRGPLTWIWVTARDSFLTFQQALSGDWVPSDDVRDIHLIVGRIGSALSTASSLAAPFIDTLSTLAKFFGVVADDGDFLNDFLRDLPKPIQPIIAIVGEMVTHWRTFMTVMNPVASIISRFLILFGRQGLTGAIEGLPDIIRDVTGEFRTAGSLIARLLGAIGTAAKDALEDVDWAGLAEDAMDLLSDGFGAVMDIGSKIFGTAADIVGGVDWAGVASDAVDLIGDGFDAVTGFGARFGGWIISQVTGVDYGGLAGSIIDGIMTGLTAIADFGGRFLGWITSTITGVDWSGLAGTIINGIVTGFWAVTDFGSRFLGWITPAVTGVDWSGIANAITSGISSVISQGRDIGQSIADQLSGFDFAGSLQGAGEGASGILDRIVDFGGLQGRLSGLMDILDPFVSMWRDDLMATFQEFAPILDELRPAWESIGGSIQNITPALKVVGAILGGVLILAITGVIKQLRLMATVAVPTIIAGIQLFTGALESVSGIIMIVQSTIEGLVRVVVALVRGDWSTAWEEADKMFRGIWNGIVTFFQGLPATLIGILWNAVNGIIDAVTSLGRDLIWGSLIPDMITDIVAEIGRLPGEAIAWFVDFATQAVEKMATLAGDLLTKGAEIVTGLIDGIGSKFGDLTMKVGEIATNILNFVMDPYKFLWNKAVDIVTGLIDAVGSKLSGVTSAMGDIKDGIKDFIANPKEFLKQAGKDLIQGLIDGVGSMKDIAIEGIKGVGSDILGGLGDTFGLGSPSRITRQYGRWLVQGVPLGARQELPPALSAMEQIGQSILDQVNETINAGRSQATASAAQLIDAMIEGMINEVDTAGFANHFVDDMAAELARRRDDIAIDLQLAQIAGDEDAIKAIQEQLTRVNTLIQQFETDAGATLREVMDAGQVEGAVVASWESLLSNIDQIIDGTLQESLTSQLQTLQRQLAAARAGGAPQAVVDGIMAAIGDTEAQLKQAGVIMNQMIQDGFASDPAIADWESKLDNLAGIVDGTLRESVMDKLKGLNDELAFAVAAGAPEAVIAGIEAGIAANEAKLAEIGQMTQDAVAAGLMDDQQMAMWESAADRLSGVFSGQLAKTLETDLADAKAKLQFALVEGWPDAIVDKLQNDVARLEGELSDVGQQMSTAAASGLLSDSAMAEWIAANEAWSQITSDNVNDVLDIMDAAGQGFMDPLIRAVQTGVLEIDDAADRLSDGMLETLAAQAEAIEAKLKQMFLSGDFATQAAGEMRTELSMIRDLLAEAGVGMEDVTKEAVSATDRTKQLAEAIRESAFIMAEREAAKQEAMTPPEPVEIAPPEVPDVRKAIDPAIMDINAAFIEGIEQTRPVWEDVEGSFQRGAAHIRPVLQEFVAGLESAARVGSPGALSRDAGDPPVVKQDPSDIEQIGASLSGNMQIPIDQLREAIIMAMNEQGSREVNLEMPNPFDLDDVRRFIIDTVNAEVEQRF